tara:strand:- start:249 stop:443 length:195 start_codon:yes stop_codon:yes gene_type:complete
LYCDKLLKVNKHITKRFFDFLQLTSATAALAVVQRAPLALLAAPTTARTASQRRGAGWGRQCRD